MIKLKQILENLNLEGDVEVDPTVTQEPSQQQAAPVADDQTTLTTEDKKRLMDMVSRFNVYGECVYREKKLSEVANELKEIVKLTESYLVNESDDFVEANTAKRHLQEIKKYCESFGKIAEDIDAKHRQLEGLYKDIGTRLETYFEIKDVVPSTQSVDPSLQDPRTVDPQENK